MTGQGPNIFKISLRIESEVGQEIMSIDPFKCVKLLIRGLITQWRPNPCKSQKKSFFFKIFIFFLLKQEQ